MGYDSHIVQGACVKKFLGEMVNFKMMTQASFLDGLVPMACFMWKLYPFPAHTPELVRGQPATEGECRQGKFWGTLWPASCTPDCPLCLALDPAVKSAFPSKSVLYQMLTLPSAQLQTCKQPQPRWSWHWPNVYCLLRHSIHNGALRLYFYHILLAQWGEYPSTGP